MDQNALFDAIARGELPPDVAVELLDAPKAESSYAQLTPLEVALLCGHVAVADALFERGAKVDAPDALMRTPLFYFAGRKEREALVGIDWLVAHGANVHTATAKGSTALHRTADTAGFFPDHFVAIAKKLLAAGARHSASNQVGFTPLLQAVRNHGADFIRAMVEAGADINARSTAGATALHLVPVSYVSWQELDEQHSPAERDAAGDSAESIAQTMIECLLSLGARRDLKTNDGSTAYDLAQRVGLPVESAALLRP